jgi:phosphoadenosine phosphosulfate reductase
VSAPGRFARPLTGSSPTVDAGRFDDAELARQAARLEGAVAADIVAWAVDTFGAGLCLTASMTDAVLIDVATRVEPVIEVVFLDTGYHFPETLATVEAVRRRYHPQLRVVSADRPLDDLWRTDPDACCAARKVAPLDELLAGRTAWLSGLRRADGPDRADTAVLERDRRGLVKVNPLVAWTDDDVAAYTARHDVIVNPLVAQGYPSIGCWPCTRAVAAGEDARAGRWSGTAKTECGLHL